MIRRLYLFITILLLAISARAEVIKIVVDDMIHPITDEYIERAIAEATKSEAQALLIQLRTPGGLSESTLRIVEKMLASKVPVIVYVAPSGSRAASAGFFILQAADVAAMAPGTNTGAAHPVVLGGKVDDVMKSKMENDAAASMRAYVSKRGRNVAAAESAVRESKSWTAEEALEQKLIDIVAANEAELLQKLNGREITRFNGAKATLKTAGQPVREFPMSLRQRVLAFIMDPNVAFILFSIGMLALYAEFNHPGLILPGVIGLVFILLAVFALNILPTRFAALILIAVAFGLFILEAKFTSYGILGTGGVVLLVIGGMLLVDGPIPEMRVKLWTALAVSVPLGIITIFLMTLALRAHQNKITTGQQGLVGEIGTVQTPLAPFGQVFVHGEIWNASAAEPIPPGTRVVVREVDGLQLKVEAAGEPATPDRA